MRCRFCGGDVGTTRYEGQKCKHCGKDLGCIITIKKELKK